MTDDHYIPNEDPCVICKILRAEHYEASRSLTRLDQLAMSRAYKGASEAFVETHAYRTKEFLMAKENLRKHICYRRTQWFR